MKKGFFVLMLLALLIASTSLMAATLTWSVTASPAKTGTFTVTTNPTTPNINPSKFTVQTGAYVYVQNVVPKTNYYLDSVKKDGQVDFYWASGYGPVSSGHKIVLYFKLKPVITASASPKAGGTITPPGKEYVEYNGVKTYTVSPNAGYYVKSFKVDGKETPITNNTYTFSNVVKSHTIGVTFAANPVITATASPTAGGTISPSGKVPVEYKGSKSFTVAAKTGYDIKSLKVNGKDVSPKDAYTFTNVTKANTILAIFAIKTFTVTSKVTGGHGKISPAEIKKNVKYGSSLTYSAKPDKGYRSVIYIDGVFKKLGDDNKPLTYKYLNITSNSTVEAKFIPEGTQPVLQQNTAIAIVGLGDSIKVTNTTPVTIHGVASSDAGISSVTWVNQTTGATGTATGTDDWSAIVALAGGDNTIKFTANASDSSTSDVTSIITYNPSIDFTTPLQTNKSNLNTGVAFEVTFTIGLQESTTATVKLYQVAGDGTLTELGQMFDNGVLPDEIDKDGNFTLKTSVTPSADGYIYYKVGVTKTTGTGDVTYYSEITKLWASPAITPEQVTKAVTIADNAQNKFDAVVNSGKSISEAADEVKNTLKSDPNIGAVDTTPDGSVWWITNDGLLGLVEPDVAGKKSGRGGVPGKTPTYFPVPQIVNYPAEYIADRSQYVPNYSGEANIKADPPKNEVKSKKAIIISPFINNPTGSNFGNSDDYYGAWKILQDSDSCYLFDETAIVNDGAQTVTLDNFKNFSSYGYIHFSTHGDNLYNGLFSNWKDVWGPNDWLKGSFSQVVINTGVTLTKDVDGKWIITGYEDDLKAKRIAISGAGRINMLPGFFSHYLGSLPNSVVVLSCCRSMYNNSMANVFLSKGAGAVLGFSDYVASGYAKNTTQEVMTQLLAGKKTKEAYDSAITKFGVDDGTSDHAKFLMTGADDLELSTTGIENAGFEEGSLKGWSKAGDGRVVTQLGGTTPTEGIYMGIISTGLGYTTSSGSISQTFCLRATVDKLTFDWNFFSEEFKEYCFKGYNDKFLVKLEVWDDVNKAWTEYELETETVDGLCGSVSASDVSFDQGGVFNTGWRSSEIDLTPYAAKKVKLTFYSTDVGDSVYDTAILIDNIVISELITGG